MMLDSDEQIADGSTDPVGADTQDQIVALGAPVISGCNVSQLFNVTSAQNLGFIAVQGTNLQNLNMQLYTVNSAGQSTLLNQAAQATTSSLQSLLSQASQASSSLLNATQASNATSANSLFSNNAFATNNNVAVANNNAYQTATTTASNLSSGNIVNNAYATNTNNAFGNQANTATAANTKLVL